jgi:NADP-dependent 3-hydroxy acid dehydrogenase YdfG
MAKQLSVLVTGASSGIGRATAVEFARRGHTVFASARREGVLADLAAAVPGIRAVGLDVTDPASIDRAWAKILADTGGAGVDVLVNNAGFALAGPVEALTGDDVRRQFDTNVFGLLAVTRAVLPSMRARGSGRIVNLSSVVGRTTFPAMGVYGATKYAVEALSDALRQEVSGLGVQVVIIEPGFVATGIGESADAVGGSSVGGGSVGGSDQVSAAYADLVAAGSRYAAAQVAKGTKPERVAAVIADAATRPNPRDRYAVPASARVVITLFTGLPGRLADWAKRRAIGSA